MRRTRKYSAAGTPPRPLEVILLCRSELLLMGLERLLAKEAGLAVRTYQKLPSATAESEPIELPPEESLRPAPRTGAPVRVCVLSDRGIKDLPAECQGVFESLADRIVLLASRPDVSDALAAMGAGVRSFLTEGEDPDVLLAAIGAAARDRTYLSYQMLDLMVEWLAERESGEGARSRGAENDLLQMLAEGRSTAEIAEVLGIAPKTVRNRVSKLYRRLGVHSRAAAVRLAEERGMLDPADPGRGKPRRPHS